MSQWTLGPAHPSCGLPLPVSAEHECREGGCPVDWLLDPNGPSRQEWRQRGRAEYEADWVPPGTNRSKRA